MGGAMPTLKLVLEGTAARANPPLAENPEKFKPIDLAPHFTASSLDLGPREQAKELGGASAQDGLIRTPAGKQNFRGIPFWLGPEGTEKKNWVVLAKQNSPWSRQSLEIPLGQKAGFICLAGFCDWDSNESPSPNEDVIEKVGQSLADAILIYEDGTEKILPIRRRFEVNAPSISWGHQSFASLAHVEDTPRKLSDPLNDALQWGDLQTSVWENTYGAGPDGKPSTLPWICALANAEPTRVLKGLRLKATSDDPLVLCGLTLFEGHENPLRYERLSLYRITLPEPAAEDKQRWKVEVDLGVVARTYFLSSFEPETWLSAPDKGLGARDKPVQGSRYLYAEVTASSEATLSLSDTKKGKQYAFDLGGIVPNRELEARPSGSRIEILERDKVWLQGQVVDGATQKPTPVRLAFRSREGRYIPPYGHRAEINDGWFQDYGADVKLMDTSFAYVDGTFQVELPVGEVYLEMTKGFEYVPVRKKLKIEPHQRELKLEVSRLTDFRSQGWVTADTHVHFLSPTTAVLEGQAEGLNLINLLAAQWGDLFTNVGDLSQGPLTSRDGEMMVWVGTENRQHLLGHLGLLGVKGRPVFPMSAGGPGESYLGDPLWSNLGDWTEACRKREGLVVAVHFPYPTAELAADIVLGKIDAVELYPFGEHFNTLRFLDWYRYLNCGYRLPAVGGTDKMGAYMPAGANRTYAYLGQDEFSFANFAKAVRRGNTFMTTGPLLLLRADGQMPGAEIKLGAGGGVPFHRLEVVLNGRVVASREESAGSHEMTLREKVSLSGSGWLAARCASKMGPTTGWGLGIQAHTSPVYVSVPGQELFSAPAASYFLTLIDGAETWARNLATRADPERMARALQVFIDAREHLHRRLHQHGIKH
ncbi:MAG: hypothetical protein DMG05_13610 [Acidobacteria bacterium]|nr:MAG: hypothetical protein DMG05_13610 [Acidobacteriota bacterium]